jgi:hypothetical protein
MLLPIGAPIMRTTLTATLFAITLLPYSAWSGATVTMSRSLQCNLLTSEREQSICKVAESNLGDIHTDGAHIPKNFYVTLNTLQHTYCEANLTSNDLPLLKQWQGKPLNTELSTLANGLLRALDKKIAARTSFSQEEIIGKGC